MTVCPPEDTSTNLNYDLVNAEDDILDKDVRDELAKTAADWLEDVHFRDVMDDLDSLKEENKFKNWYLGYTKVELPYKRHPIGNRNIFEYLYTIRTTAVSGLIKTPFFGQNFTEDNFMKNLDVNLYVRLNENFTNIGSNITMVVDIELDTKETGGGDDHVQIYRGNSYNY